jgi:hypothetical protein
MTSSNVNDQTVVVTLTIGGVTHTWEPTLPTSPTATTIDNPEAKSYIERMAVNPNSTYISAIDNFFGALKSAPLSLDLFDHIHLLAMHDVDAARLNLLGGSLPIVATTPSTQFAAGIGFGGTGNGGGLTLGVTPSQLTKATQNNASLIVVVEAAGAEEGNLISVSTNPQRMVFNPRNSRGAVNVRLNNWSTHGTTATVPSRSGTWIATRDADVLSVYCNGALVEQVMGYGSSDPNLQTSFIQYLEDYSTVQTDRISLVATGGSLTAPQVAAFSKAVQDYRLAIGLAEPKTEASHEDKAPEDGPSTDEPRTPEPDASAAPSADALTWSPPALSSPTIINLPSSGDYDNGSSASSATDFELVPPATTDRGMVTFRGGRNVRLIGGRQVLNTSQFNDRAITIRDVANSVFIEGVHIDLAQESPFDGISAGGTGRWATQTQWAHVYMQNILVTGLHGTVAGLHADGFQMDYGIRNLRIDKWTSDTNYQHLFMQQYGNANNPILNNGSIDIRRANFKLNAIAGGEPDREFLSSLYFGQRSSELTSIDNANVSIILDDVWAEPEANPTYSYGAQREVRPVGGAQAPTGLGSDGISQYIHWGGGSYEQLFRDASGGPAIVRLGIPPGGDFVTAADVGIGYVSPGYL